MAYNGLGLMWKGFRSEGWCQRCTENGSAVTREAGKVTRDKLWEPLLGRGSSILPDGAWHLHGTELFLTDRAVWLLQQQAYNLHPRKVSPEPRVLWHGRYLWLLRRRFWMARNTGSGNRQQRETCKQKEV